MPYRLWFPWRWGLWLALASVLGVSVAVLVNTLLFGRVPVLLLVHGWFGSLTLVVVSVCVLLWWLAYFGLLELRGYRRKLAPFLLPSLLFLLTVGGPVAAIYLSDRVNHEFYYATMGLHALQRTDLVLLLVTAAGVFQWYFLSRSLLPGARSSERKRDGAWLTLLLVGALALHLWLWPSEGYGKDMEFFARWANALLSVRWDQFYSLGAPDCDYLPGYLYLLAATAYLHRLVSGSVAVPAEFSLWVKLVPVAADLALGVALFWLCRRFAEPRRSLVAAALVLFNPGIVVVGAMWGQVDAVAVTLAVMSLAALFSRRPVTAAVLAGVAVTVKPQHSLFLLVAGVAYLRTELLRASISWSSLVQPRVICWAIWRLGLPALVLVGTVELLLRPFSVSVWPTPGTEWTLYQRLVIARDVLGVTSANSFNLWGTPMTRLWASDGVEGWLSLSYQSWGTLLFVAAFGATLVLAWFRAGERQAVLWSCFAAAFALFVLPTRIHERYLFGAIPLLAALAVSSRWGHTVYLAISALFLVNVCYSYFGPTSLVGLASMFSVLLFLACCAGLALSATRWRWDAARALAWFLWGEAASSRPQDE